MYAVIASGGKQYRVEPGSTVTLDRMDAAVGSRVTFDRVLLLESDGNVTLGQPFISGASVGGVVVEHGRGPKLVIFKFKPKVHYRRRTGHRQEQTTVRIEAVSAADSDAPARAARPRRPRRTADDAAQAGG